MTAYMLFPVTSYISIFKIPLVKAFGTDMSMPFVLAMIFNLLVCGINMPAVGF